MITDYPFNDVVPASTGDAYVGDIWSTVFNGSGDTRRVADTTGGISPQYVLENHYPAGHASGTGVGQIFGSVSASVREFYVCMRVKFSSNYEWNTISNKFFIFEPDHIILESRHYGDYWAFDDQGLDVPRAVPMGPCVCPVGLPPDRRGETKPQGIRQRLLLLPRLALRAATRHKPFLSSGLPW